MPSRRTFVALCFALMPAAFCAAQTTAKGTESTLLKFESTAIADTSRAVLKVLIRETETSEPVLGATVLLRREADKMYGRVSQADGRCHFKIGPGDYVVRVQMTGLASFEQGGFLLEKGKSYTMEIAMAKH